MKHHDRSQIRRSVRSMLWGSTLAMILSCALFAGATHAWFTVRYSAQITVTSANFDVNVVIKKGDNTISPQDGVYSLSTGSYTVTLTRAGSATGTVGYCAITVGDDVYYSQNLSAQPEGVSFTLQIDLPERADVTFTPVWKDAESPQSSLVNSGDTIYYPAGSGLSTMRVAAQPKVDDEPAEPETNETAESEIGGSDNGTDDSQSETNNSTVENSETGDPAQPGTGDPTQQETGEGQQEAAV